MTKKEKKEWKRSFAFRLKDGDEMISRFITSSKKTESDTIRELLRFAINEIHRVKNERLLVENLGRVESKLTELIQMQQENHQEIIEILKNHHISHDNGINGLVSGRICLWMSFSQKTVKTMFGHYILSIDGRFAYLYRVIHDNLIN